MKELIDLRKKREKHFLNEDGSITAYIYNQDIHYLKGKKYQEIDNTMVDNGVYYENKENEFHTIFGKNSNDLVNVWKDNYYLRMYLKDKNELKLIKDGEIINYKNILPDIDFKYKVIASKLKEAIILNCKESIPNSIDFFIETNLELELKENKKIIAKDNAEVVFTIDSPYMFDSKGDENYCIDYQLEKTKDGYILKIVLDVEWLKSDSTYYPVTIDPTIINGTNENVYDTYISTKNPTFVANNLNFLKLGTINANDINRILLKFELPTIGTSYNIVNATAYLNAYENTLNIPTNIERVINVHAINCEWDETSATWTNMHDKYDSHVETYFYPVRNSLNGEEDGVSEFDLTNLVKKWYAGKENYGVMLKWNNENYSSDSLSYSAYSKSYDNENYTALRPYLTITYMSQNGILPYMDYNNITYNTGQTLINNFNGNVTNIFELSKTISGKLPLVLNLVYNTCDVVLNTFNSIGKGFKFNFEEIIKEQTIDSISYLEYINENSAIHYLVNISSNLYKDEEGLNISAKLVDNQYIIEDSEGNKKIFSKFTDRYLLTKIVDLENNEINVFYNSNKQINKITNSDVEEITISYNDNQIVITNNKEISKINKNQFYINNIETKNGITSFTYNSNNIIEKIIDVNSLYVQFEYYNNPFKLKKVTNYGLNNNIGNSLNYVYNFNSTTVTDNYNLKKVISFDNLGRTLGVVLYDNNSKALKDAYGFNEDYVKDYMSTVNNYNLSSRTIPIKYVSNLLLNSSFETDDINYNFNITNGVKAKDKARTGFYSLKFSKNISFEYSIQETNDYTFSFYIKKECDGIAKLYSKINDILTEIDSKTLVDYEVGNYNRYNLSGKFQSGSSLVLIIETINETDAYIDDIQLEKGKICNHYNLVNNGDFSFGTLGWDLSEDPNEYELVTLNSGEKAIKLICNPEKGNSLSKYFNISGKKGDSYNLSFWYKNEGVYDFEDYYAGNFANIQFFTTDDFGGETWNTPLKRHGEEWQFFNEILVAETDYSDFCLNIVSDFDANSIYVTNIMLTKNFGTVGYNYDENGNLVWESDLSENHKEFKYDKNNQLVASFNPKGNNFTYEYDNVVTDRILKGISPTGISNEYIYDEFGNVIKTIIQNVNPDNEIKNSNFYYIRLKGTQKYISYDVATNLGIVKSNECDNHYYELIKDGENYRIKFSNKYLTMSGINASFTNIKNDLSLFKLEKCENRSYKIIPITNQDLSLTFQNDKLIFSTKEDTWNQQFFFEDCNTNKKIIKKYEYDANRKYITKELDELEKVTEYNVDENSGLITSMTNPKGISKEYTYDNKNRLSQVKLNNYNKEYTYNDNNLLTKIISGNKDYSFTYDDFFRPKESKINNNLLINKSYDDKGNLQKVTFANNQSITNTYDNFNKIITSTKDNKTYKYLYNNVGALSKVESDNEIYEYAYDYAERLKEVINNNKLKINYDYDVNSNVSSKEIYFEGTKYDVKFIYNKDDYITEVVMDNNIEVNKIYDELGRLVSSNINNSIPCEYTYYQRGNNTSLILKSIKIDNELYEYTYDDLYNITKIKLNDEIQKEYKYDDINELIETIDYVNSKKFIYTYDLYGNILSKKELSLENELIKEDTYQYNNSNWKDQLTKYNDSVITYDNMGNTLSIGDKIFTWERGTRLKSFKENNKTFNYEYNVDGLLLKKTNDNNVNNYYYEDGVLIIEKRNNDMIYYLYDNNDNLIGFKLNGTTYYYKKNNLEDILGIYDSSYNLVVKYEYDDWGNTLVLDSNNNPITNKSHIGLINPFRYRSYYYDEDIKMYWLQSRYYNPQFGRFINIDCQISNDLIGDNLYVYCGNNPINRSDDSGKGFFSKIIGGAIVGAVVSGISKIVANKFSGKSWHDGLFGAAISGAVTGAIIGAVGPSKTLSTVEKYLTSTILAPAVGSIVGGTVEEVVSYKKSPETKPVTKENIKKSVIKVVTEASYSTAESIAGGALGKFVGKELGWNLVGRPAEKLLKCIFGKRALKQAGMDMISSLYSETVGGYLNKFVEMGQESIYTLFD